MNNTSTTVVNASQEDDAIDSGTNIMPLLIGCCMVIFRAANCCCHPERGPGVGVLGERGHEEGFINT